MQYIRTELTTTSATHELPSVSLHGAYAGRAAVSMLQYSLNGASLARLHGQKLHSLHLPHLD